MDKYSLKIHNISGLIPRNPNYEKIPIRNQEISYVVWHCDDAASWTHRELIRYDLNPNHIDSQKGCPTPTYTYYIERDGSIWQLTQEITKTWHAGVVSKYVDLCPRWNDIALAICFAFKPNKKNTFTPEQMTAGLYLTTEILLRRRVDSANVRGHRELCGTGYVPNHPDRLRKTCPGLGVDLNAVRSKIHNLKASCSESHLKIERTYEPVEGWTLEK
jgi:hypothetical protein